ncbi:MAG: DUF6169 family protein [Sphingobacteriales bacterium]
MQNFYDVNSSADGLINTFTTRFNIEYSLTLTSYQMGEIRVFSLSLYPDNENNVFDYWVKNTVIKIISEFLRTDSNIVFYVCDSEDGEEDKRHRVFEYWYAKAIELHEFIAKYNYTIKSENNYTVNSSIIYNRDNYLSDYIIQEFKKQIEIL